MLIDITDNTTRRIGILVHLKISAGCIVFLLLKLDSSIGFLLIEYEGCSYSIHETTDYYPISDVVA